MKKKDSWCKPILSKHGNIVSGGAARNVRISAYDGGMDTIIAGAVNWALEEANNAVRRGRPKLHVVK